MMQKVSSRPVKTFTIGFHEEGFNEAEHAEAVARHLGTEHTELYVTASEAMDVIPSLPTMYDEPFADSSQIPTHLVAALARRHVTVSLSGDGGDELFGGYDRYLLTANFWKRIAGIPAPLRATAARILTLVSASTWTSLGDAAAGLVPRWMQLARLGEKVHKGAPMLTSQSLEELYEYMLRQWHDPAAIVVGSATEDAPSFTEAPELAGLTGVERMMAQDMLGYLPDDILVKVDRAAMAVSLEARVPLLDPDVVEFAWSLPLDLKIRGSTTKWILRQLLYRHVPPALIERPKMGFGIPLGSWLRGPLRDWAEALIDERRLREEGFFHEAAIRRAWAKLLKGDSQQQLKLWTVLMFQSWLDSRDAGTQPASQMAAEITS
jgi:asparagine synthase (glutamine-hydrolysing)